MRRKSRGPIPRFTAAAAVLVAAMISSRSARADINLGAEAGVADRASNVPGLDPGLAFGGHAEFSLLPFIRLGAYFLHYRLSTEDARDDLAYFNAFGPRLRLIVPIPGTDLLPYAQAGIGFTVASYPGLQTADVSTTVDERSGYFFEVPVGLGLAYEIASILHISADFTFRPAFGHFGDAFDESLREPNDAHVVGWSVLGGLALDF
jgi:Outer membrane protein beta-barrel domain